MTDRIKGVYVAFEQDLRTDDVEPLLEAIKQLRGVLSVEPKVRSFNDWVAQERVRRELGEKIWEVLYPKEKS